MSFNFSEPNSPPTLSSKNVNTENNQGTTSFSFGDSETPKQEKDKPKEEEKKIFPEFNPNPQTKEVQAKNEENLSVQKIQTPNLKPQSTLSFSNCTFGDNCTFNFQK